MNALEQEIIEKFRQLDYAAQQRVRDLIVHEASTNGSEDFDYEAWLAQVKALQASIRQRRGDDATVDALSLLDEVREESS